MAEIVMIFTRARLLLNLENFPLILPAVGVRLSFLSILFA